MENEKKDGNEKKLKIFDYVVKLSNSDINRIPIKVDSS